MEHFVPLCFLIIASLMLNFALRGSISILLWCCMVLSPGSPKAAALSLIAGKHIDDPVKIAKDTAWCWGFFFAATAGLVAHVIEQTDILINAFLP